jgi:hypothetical protein
MGHKVFVDLELSDVSVAAKDFVFKVYRGRRGKKKFGELRISQGAVVWRGHNDKDGRKLNWLRFDALMQMVGTRAERRPPGVRLSVPRRRLRG